MDYEQLTQLGRLRRLRPIAIEAARLCGLANPDLRFHGYSTNCIYRARAASGERFIIRLASPGWRTLRDLTSEAMWLDALEGVPGIHAPRVLHAVDGRAVLPLTCPGIREVWNVTIMSRQPGIELTHSLTSDNLRKMGELFARLHIHGKSWERPTEFTDRRFDGFLSRGEPCALPEGGNQGPFTIEQAGLLAQVRERVEEAYCGLDRNDLRVIHCDLWHGNIRIDRGDLYPFDFEDTVLGFRLHDIAMAMLDLLDEVGRERYPVLLAAFRDGYERLLPWPEGSMEALQAGRILWIINWVARFSEADLGHAVGRYEPALSRFCRTGRLLPAD